MKFGQYDKFTTPYASKYSYHYSVIKDGYIIEQSGTRFNMTVNKKYLRIIGELCDSFK